MSGRRTCQPSTAVWGRALRQEHAWQVGGPVRRQCGWNKVGGGQRGHWQGQRSSRGSRLVMVSLRLSHQGTIGVDEGGRGRGWKPISFWPCS